MNPIAQVWDCTYRADRRKHRHRCRCCRRIIQPGAPVVMARIANRRTWVVHSECADQKHSAALTWREVFHEWTKPKPETRCA